MNIKISGQNVEVTDDLRQSITEKITKLEKHLQKITGVHVVLHEDKINQMADATINHRGGQLRATGSAGDMFAAIQAMVEKLDRQAIKFKEKNHDHGRGHEENEE